MPTLAERTDETLIKLIERYGPPAGEPGPERFVREMLQVEVIDDWQIRVLRAYGRGERRIAIRSCHGVGKTAVAAWCILHQLLFRFPQKVVATAPTKDQLFNALFPEVLKWFGKLPQALRDLYVVKTESISLAANPAESFFRARTARVETPEALAGVHCDPGYVLLLADEGSAVPEPIFEAASGSMSQETATTFLLGNPTRTSGLFYRVHTYLRKDIIGPDGWFTIHVSYKDSPRVGEDFARQIANTYGEESNAYRVRVLGEFPKSEDDTVIPFEWVEAARNRELSPPPADTARVWGLDVARFGSNKSVLCERQGYYVHEMTPYQGLDTMQLCGRVKQRYNDLPPHLRPKEILVDVIGIGAGVVDRLRELNLPVRGINVAESASESDRFKNLRAELWWAARDWFEGKKVRLGPDVPQILADELVSQRLDDPTSTGKIRLKKKERGASSPDYADAFVLTFASSAAVFAGGNDSRVSWNEPLKRNLKGIV